MRHDVNIDIPESMKNLLDSITNKLEGSDEMKKERRERISSNVKTYGPIVASLVVGYSLGYKRGMVKVLKTPITIKGEI